MSPRFRLLAVFAAAAAMPIASSMAADYDPPIYIEEAPEMVPVEIGSGWYLRGDVSYHWNKAFEQDSFGADPFFEYSERTLPVGGSIGVGYNFSDFLRAEANIGFLSSYKYSHEYLNVGVSEIEASAENSLWSGIVAVYGDLGTVAGFTPYVGAGAGAVSHKYSYTLDQDYFDPDVLDVAFHDSERSYSFAYTLGAGVSYEFAPNVSVDLGYQYLSAPNAEYVEVTGIDSYERRKGIDLHQIKLGLRYDLW